MKMKLIAQAAIIAAGVTFVGVGNAAPNKVEEAFASMTNSGSTNVNGAKRYNGTLRSGVDFGSGRLSTGVSQAKISLLNFTPAQVTAGCGGIDFHLGGISWVNWDQFSALLDSVLMAAQYAVVSMALDWISEKLGSTFKTVMAALQKATTMEIDSCKIGKNVAEQVAKGFGYNPTDARQSFCEQESQTVNESDSFMTAGRLCSSFNKALEKSVEWAEKTKAKYGLGGSKNSDGSTVAEPDPNETTDGAQICIGNCTWQTLKGMGFAPTLLGSATANPTEAATSAAVHNYLSGVSLSELMQSSIGVRWGFGDNGGSTTAAPESPQPSSGKNMAPMLSPELFVAIFMCGTDYILAADEAAITAAAGVIGDAAGDASVKQSLVDQTLKDMKGVCEQLKKIGASSSNGEQVKVITCMPPDVASDYAQPSGDTSDSVNDPVLAGINSLGGPQMKNAKDLCQYPQEIPLTNWAAQPYVRNSLLSKGFLSRNMEIMQSMFVKMIRGDQELSPDEINFVLASPTPVYQMISMAALFPSQGIHMVQSSAIMISALQVESFIDRLVNDSLRNATTKIPVWEEDALKLAEFVGRTQRVYGKSNIDVDRQISRMTAFQGQVRTMQTAVMDSIYGRQLLGNMTFGSDITAATTP